MAACATLEKAWQRKSSASGQIKFLGYGACALAGTLWGTGFYWGRLALDEMNVEHMVLYRFLFACLGMAPVMLGRRARLTAGEWRTMLLAAAFGIPIQFLLQFHGLVLTTVSHASLMVGAMPVLLAAAAAIFAGERLDWIGWLALFASTCGAAMVVLGGDRATTGRETPSLLGDLLVIASLVVALAWILLSKKLMETHSPPVVTAYTIYSGTLMLIAWELGSWLLAPADAPEDRAHALSAHVSLTAWIALAISGIFCTADHNPLVELGHPSRAGLARRRLSQHRAGARFHPRRGTAGRAPGPLRVAGRRAHPRRSHHPDHPRPRTGAGRDPGVKDSGVGSSFNAPGIQL